jgi:hypothetical protein
MPLDVPSTKNLTVPSISQTLEPNRVRAMKKSGRGKIARTPLSLIPQWRVKNPLFRRGRDLSWSKRMGMMALKRDRKLVR